MADLPDRRVVPSVRQGDSQVSVRLLAGGHGRQISFDSISIGGVVSSTLFSGLARHGGFCVPSSQYGGAISRKSILQ